MGKIDEERAKLRFGFSCRNDFGDLYNDTEEQKLNRMGVSREQLDFSRSAKKYFTDYFTIDENANATHFGAGNYEIEITKSFLKLDAMYMLHKFLSKKDIDAKSILGQILDGEIYVHDLHTLFDRPYCLGISLNMMRIEGIPFSELRSLPAKRSSTFMKQAAELVFILSNSFAGATAESDILVQYANFIEKESKTDKEITQDFQEYIHTVNNELRQSQQSPFTNVSIYDKYVLENLINDAGLDVSIDTVMRIQNLWMKFFGEGSPSGLPYRFPVTSINLYTIDNQIQDNELFTDACEYGKKLAPFNFYCSTGLKYTSCCLSGDTKIIHKGKKGIAYVDMSNIHGERKMDVLLEGDFLRGNLFEVKNQKLFEIKLSNGVNIFVTKDHLHLTRKGIMRTDELMKGDRLPFTRIGYDGDGGSYDLGRLIGLYIAEGNGAGKGNYIDISTHPDENVLRNFICDWVNSNFGITTSESLTKSAISKVGSIVLKIYGKTFSDFVSEFVGGDRATNKYFKSKIFKLNKEFRKGVLDGWREGDGSTRDGRIYTASFQLKEDAICLGASLGLIPLVREDNRKKEDGKLSDNVVYSIHLSKPENKNRNPDNTFLVSDRVWIAIDSIKETSRQCNVYDFEMETEEHLFQLANGLITHNCRLIYDVTKLRSIQSDSWGAGLNMGSTRVCTINLPYLALKSQRDKVDFYELLKEALISSYNIHVVNREMLYRLIDKNFIPVFKPYNWLSKKMFFSTFGVNGLFETAQILSSEDPIPSMKQIIIFIEKFAEEKSKLDFPLNVEFVPAESSAAKLAFATNKEFKTDYTLFSNQIVPLDTDYDLIDRMEITGQIAPLFSGGSLLHLNVNEHITDTNVFKKLITMAVAEGVDHLAVNYIFDMCDNNHGFVGGTCPYCNQPSTDTITRTVGYYVSTKKWNKMRQAETRQWY